MFSKRTNLPQEENALSRARAERQRRGLPIVDLTIGNPTEVGLGVSDDELWRAIATPGIARYEPHPLGLRSARERLARRFKDRDPPIQPDQLLLTASTSEAYGFIFKLLCDPGDNVLIPEPSYPLFAHLAAFENVELRPYRLAYDGAWHVDLDSLRSARTDRTRAVLSVSPNNPTGSYLKRDELAAMAGLGLPLVCDEVFAEYPLCDDPRRAGSVLECADVLCFSLGGLSKLCGMPQMKLAWTAVGGPAAQRDEALARLELIADAYLSAATPVQLALPELLRLGERARDAIQRRTAANHQKLLELTSNSTASVLHLEGGWYATLRLPATRSEDEWVMELLERHGILVQPGWLFDFGWGPVIVVSLLVDPASLQLLGTLEELRS